MRDRVFALIAAGFLLAACETAPEETAVTSSAGEGSETQEEVITPALPPGPDPTSQEWLVINVGDRVFFDFDKSDLTPEARGTIEEVVAWMQSNPDVTLTVEGHCDERGTREYNLALGERRANSVRSYMESLGVESSRLSILSFGKEQPAVLGSNEQAWAQNRRAVFIVN